MWTENSQKYKLDFEGAEAVEDRKAWHALVHGVTKSWTRLND